MVIKGLTGQGGVSTALLPLGAAALWGGIRFSQQAGGRPAPREAWALAAVFALTGYLASLPLVLIALALLPDLAARLSGWPLAAGALVYVAAGTLIARISIAYGGRIAERQAGERDRD